MRTIDPTYDRQEWEASGTKVLLYLTITDVCENDVVSVGKRERSDSIVQHGYTRGGALYGVFCIVSCYRR